MNLKNHIEEILGEPINSSPTTSGIIRTPSGKEYYLKVGTRSRTFQCEANGLREIANADVIRTPEVMAVTDYFIMTEYISGDAPMPDFFSFFGEQLARLHRTEAPEYGFYEDNYIGRSPQPNIPKGEEVTDWVAFYFNKRLLFQYKMAERNGYVTPTLRAGFKRVEQTIEPLLRESCEKPCLLHGDLWSGNYICDVEAVLIDPAVYYGHREADLAMTKLFGGFSPDFYKSYQSAYPLKPGWQQREKAYLLYHLLNHLNIFGRGYLAETEEVISMF